MQTVYRLLKLNYFLKGHRAKFAAAYAAHNLGIRHLAIRFDPVMACNLRCRMCYFSNDDYVKSVKGMFTPEDVERLASMLFPRSLLVVFGCSTEPTIYKNWPELVKLAKRYGVPNVGMTTNGQLIKPEAIEKIIDYGLDEITISCHGVKRETYERFMTKASFDTFHSVLRNLTDAKRRRGVSHPQLRINYTVNSDNLAELDSFFEVFDDYDIKTLQVRPIMDIEGEYRSPIASGELDHYNGIITRLGKECERRGIRYLANTADPTYQETNDHSVILQAVQRYVGPMNVWREDFDWRQETYNEYCRRVGWNSYLLKCVFSNIQGVLKYNSGFAGKYAAKYEVTL